MGTTLAQIESVADIRPLLARGESLCLVEESQQYPGNLAFLYAGDQERFVRDHIDYLSPLSMLNDVFMLRHFIRTLREEGTSVFLLPSALRVVDDFDRWSQPLEIDGLDLPNGGSLFPFQQFALRQAIERAEGTRFKVSGFFFNFGTGTGKSVVAAAGAQELFNLDRIDLVVFFTMRKLKINMARVVNDMTQLTAVVPDGTKEKRRKQYQEEADVFVLNVEKARFDFDELFHLLSGKRVLWVADEVQTILRGENDKNKSRSAIEDLMRVTKRSYVWPMSASVVKHSPLRYHDAFAFHTPNHNPLGSRQDFISRYATVTNGYFGKEYTWDLEKLIEVRHRVNGHGQAVRKTDPGVRERFKGMTTQVIDVQLSRDEWALHEAIRADLDDQMQQPREEGEPPPTTAHHYALIRTMCNTPESLLASESSVAERIRNRHPELPYKQSTKFEMICDKIEEIRGAGDQVVVFTHWTHLSLFQLSRMLDERGIRHVQHYGTGMTDRQAQIAQDSFKADPDITVFLSSDAGAFGLNFTNARYVIHVEPLFDWDTFMQRSDRIDRADSYLDGLTAYVFVTDSPVEQRVWKVMNLRRKVAAVTQGTVETATRLTPEELELAGMSESQAMAAVLRP